jgi:uncharacterized protein YecA (UPF0149 family)
MGFYSPLLRMFDHAVEERFLKTENRALVLARDQPADLLQALEDWRRRTLRNGWTGRRGDSWRNDPCPCGSGKKNKRCCGGAAGN